MIDASPPDWGDEKLGLPSISIRPGIVARSGGEIHVPPYVRRGNTRGFRMARQHGTRQPAPGRRDGDDHRRGAIRRLARVTAMAATQLLSRAAQGRQIVARRRQPQVAALGHPIPCLVPHTGNGASVFRGLVSTRRGWEESGTNAPSIPSALARGLLPGFVPGRGSPPSRRPRRARYPERLARTLPARCGARK